LSKTIKKCPDCGKKFNWWQRAIGENKEHVRNCCRSKKQTDDRTLAASCRGCPAGCFDGIYNEKEKER
jgi:hypothetical protein